MKRRVLAAVLMAAMFGVTEPATPVAAQLGWSGYAVGEFDSDDLKLGLVGASVGVRRSGWAPVGGVQLLWMEFGSGTTVTSILPSVGLRNNFGTGSFGFRVGYNFSNREIDGFAGSSGDIGDGVTNSVSVDYWGTGNVYLQGLASYNYGSENLWSRARAMTRLAGFGSDGNFMGGAEVAFLNGSSYSSLQPGIVVGFTPSRGTTFNFGVGRRLGDGNDATYFKAELALSGR